MKINVDIDLDWIEEDSTLDETIKKEIIGRVVNKIQESAEKQIIEDINKVIVNRINKATDKLFRDFLKRGVTVTDKYGDTIKTYKNVRDVIKERFDKFMTETVDENGKSYTGSYNRKYDRLTYIIDKQLKDIADTFTSNAVKTVSEEIEKHVSDGLTTKLGAELMRVLKINDMLKLPK